MVPVKTKAKSANTSSCVMSSSDYFALSLISANGIFSLIERPPDRPESAGCVGNAHETPGPPQRQTRSNRSPLGCGVTLSSFHYSRRVTRVKEKATARYRRLRQTRTV
jgi:hypothetical protein